MLLPALCSQREDPGIPMKKIAVIGGGCGVFQYELFLSAFPWVLPYHAVGYADEKVIRGGNISLRFC